MVFKKISIYKDSFVRFLFSHFRICSRLPEESGCLVPTVVPQLQRYGDETTRESLFATHADSTTNYTG